LRSLHENVRDFEHGLPGLIGFHVCADCGLIVQAPAPTLASLQAAYPTDYRAHMSGQKASGLAALLRRLKEIQARFLISRLLPFLSDDRDLPVLDIGCGSGHVLFALRDNGFGTLTGIDRTPGLSQDFDGTNIRYRVIDLETEGDFHGTYEAIIMVNTIEHFLDPGDILARCRKSLRTGGKVIVITPNADAVSRRFFGGYWSGLHAPRHTMIFNPKNFELLAGNRGFEQVYSRTIADPGSWAISFQNWILGRQPRTVPHSRGTAWYSIAMLPFWHVLAVAEQFWGRGSSFLSVLTSKTNST
jgi:SAM-dependent methyltransferase